MQQERWCADASQEKALSTATSIHHAWQRAEYTDVQDLLNYQSCLICLAETWLNETDPESAIDLEGFTVVRADRKELR